MIDLVLVVIGFEGGRISQKAFSGLNCDNASGKPFSMSDTNALLDLLNVDDSQPDKGDHYPELFKGMSEKLMNDFVLMVNGHSYRLAEIEFYLTVSWLGLRSLIRRAANIWILSRIVISTKRRWQAGTFTA